MGFKQKAGYSSLPFARLYILTKIKAGYQYLLNTFISEINTDNNETDESLEV